MPIVETLEGLRTNIAMAVAGVYYPNAQNDTGLLMDLCRQIRRRVDRKGGIVTLDGQSGTGKTTLSDELKTVYECMYPGQRFQFMPFDELRRPWSVCSTLKEIALGGKIETAEMLEFCELIGSTLTPAEEYDCEQHLWRIDDFQDELRVLRGFMNSGDACMTMRREGTYVRTFGEPIPPKDKYYRFKKGDVVLVEGKFVNLEGTQGLSDMSIRLDAEPDEIRRRFEIKRSTFMPADAVALHMLYFDRVNAPSWYAYNKSTASNIHRTVRV